MPRLYSRQICLVNNPNPRVLRAIYSRWWIEWLRKLWNLASSHWKQVDQVRNMYQIYTVLSQIQRFDLLPLCSTVTEDRIPGWEITVWISWYASPYLNMPRPKTSVSSSLTRPVKLYTPWSPSLGKVMLAETPSLLLSTVTFEISDKRRLRTVIASPTTCALQHVQVLFFYNKFLIVILQVTFVLANSIYSQTTWFEKYVWEPVIKYCIWLM